jgi:hypothetical protein
MNDQIKHNLDLTSQEKARLRKKGVKLKDLKNYPVQALCEIMDIPRIRAMEIYALTEFQAVPSIGIKFAHDLISLGYYTLDELKDKDGALLINDLELLTGAWIDPCVEDQCRLVVYFANNRDSKKNWWDFTEERKKYRAENHYPDNRPKKPWFQLEKYNSNQ